MTESASEDRKQFLPTHLLPVFVPIRRLVQRLPKRRASSGLIRLLLGMVFLEVFGVDAFRIQLIRCDVIRIASLTVRSCQKRAAAYGSRICLPRFVAMPGVCVLLPPPAEYRSAMFWEPNVSMLEGAWSADSYKAVCR